MESEDKDEREGKDNEDFKGFTKILNEFNCIREKDSTAEGSSPPPHPPRVQEGHK